MRPATLVVTAALLLVGPVTVMAAPAPQGGPRPLAVSVPAEPTPVAPGATASVRLRVLNPGTGPVTVSISGRALELRDNGGVAIESGPDPLWQGLVSFPPGLLTVPAQGYLDTELSVRVPPDISPDLYFIGFLVTPQATGSGNIKIINQIGSFVTVDVPGPRLRELRATIDGSRFVLGTHSRGTVRIHNVGHAVVRFWGESDTTSTPGGGRSHQRRIDPSLLPTGHGRKLTVSGRPAWPIGFVTMKIRLIYPDRTEAATRELVLRRRILVASPIAVAALVAMLGAATTWGVRRYRRRG